MKSLEITGMSFAARQCVCNSNADEDYEHGFLHKVEVNAFM